MEAAAAAAFVCFDFASISWLTHPTTQDRTTAISLRSSAEALGWPVVIGLSPRRRSATAAARAAAAAKAPRHRERVELPQSLLLDLQAPGQPKEKTATFGTALGQSRAQPWPHNVVNIWFELMFAQLFARRDQGIATVWFKARAVLRKPQPLETGSQEDVRPVSC